MWPCAFAEADLANGLGAARRITDELQAGHADPAASVLEGLVHPSRPRRQRPLAATLSTTTCIESMISVARTTLANVKH